MIYAAQGVFDKVTTIMKTVAGRRIPLEVAMNIYKANVSYIERTAVLAEGQNDLFEGLYIADKDSVFSTLNNLVHITLHPAYDTLCGYTQEELESCFAPLLEELAAAYHCNVPETLTKIRRWYNGFSTLVFFEQQTFTNLWVETKTATCIVAIIKKYNNIQLMLKSPQMKQSDFNSFDYQTLNTQLLLFQSEYLTVKRIEQEQVADELMFTFEVLNYELRLSLMDYLTGYPVDNTGSMRSRMIKQLLNSDVTAFETSLKVLFANIPYQLYIKRQAYYHSMLLLWLNMLGFHVEAEVSTIEAALTRCGRGRSARSLSL
ncbi:MAG: AAA family ATPase [Bacteroidales bacterium]|jgi:uncharacterized membrane protein|nr:AAA family ATPase [Bacteroidales bacterium]